MGIGKMYILNGLIVDYIPSNLALDPNPNETMFFIFVLEHNLRIPLQPIMFDTRPSR
jgi:hypothetical protein